MYYLEVQLYQDVIRDQILVGIVHALANVSGELESSFIACIENIYSSPIGNQPATKQFLAQTCSLTPDTISRLDACCSNPKSTEKKKRNLFKKYLKDYVGVSKILLLNTIEFSLLFI